MSARRKLQRERNRVARREQRSAARAGDLEAIGAELDARIEVDYEVARRGRRPAQRRTRHEGQLENVRLTIEHAERWRREHPDDEPTADEPEFAWVHGRYRARSTLSQAEREIAISIRDARDAGRWFE
jgi:hypothetical protein